MFGFLKKKLKEAVSSFSKKVEEEKITFEEEVIPEKKEEKKGILSKIKEKITTRKISDDQFEKLFWDLEVALLENNVAVEVIDKIKQGLKTDLVDIPLERKQIENKVKESLKNSIKELFVNSFNLLKEIKSSNKPYTIVFVGINGSGKTTTIAKIANFLKNNHLSVVLGAADTFRAASIEQIQQHANNLGIKLIKHDYGSDPAAVAFDTVKYAKAHNIDVVLIDTAGRMHSNTNLMDEIKKVNRVVAPNLKIFVGESITGNDCVEQSKAFNEAIKIDGIILAKADIDEKGGAAISISYVTGKPIIYIGTGQEYDKIEKFDPDKILEKLAI